MASLPQRTATRPRPPLVAAALSFIWPGLGQWYLGQPRRALLYGVPVLLLAIVLAVQLGAGLTLFAARLLDPAFSSIVLVLLVLLAAWRLLAIGDAAMSRGRREALRGRSAIVLAALTVAVLATNGVVAYYAWSFYEAGSQIFVGSGADGGPATSPAPNATPGAPVPTPTDDYNVGPFETPATAASRITVLFTGIDKTTARDHSLNDTLLVVSVDPATHKVVMVSFPRDIAGFPLYSGGTYAGKINSLMSYAAGHPDRFPDGPLPTLARELSFLLGVPINYFAAIDLDGFERMIEAVGPITIDVPQAVNDPTYSFEDGSPLGFSISAGVHVLDPRLTLAYVRSRHGDSDYSRAARQQQVLLALRAKLTDPAMIGNVPGLLTIAGETIRTNFPVERLSEMLVLAQGLGTASTEQFVLKPPTYSVHPPTTTTGGTWLLRIRWNAIRQLSVDVFGSSSAFWTGQFTASGSPIPKKAP